MDNSSCHAAAMHWVKFVSTKCGVGTVGHLPWAAVDPQPMAVEAWRWGFGLF